MNSAQVWTIISVFVVTLGALVTLVLRLIEARIDGLRVELATLREHVDRHQRELLARLGALHDDLRRHERVLAGEESPPP